jgi:hypothetical protein
VSTPNLKSSGLTPVASDRALGTALGEALLVPADVAGPMCGRSEASWWRDHAAGRIPAPLKFPGRTLWSVRELEEWIAAGGPDRKTWETIRGSRKGGHR